MFHSLYNHEKPALHHHSPSEERRLIKNQPDSIKSARFSRISKILSNQQDSLESARLPLSRFQPRNPADTRPRLPSIEPSPSTATHSLGSRSCRLHLPLRDFSGTFGFVGYCRVGLEPFIDCVVRCPVPPCGSFSLWPQAF